MKCPYCGAESKVLDSRPVYDAVRRRRQCLLCEERFTTIELCVEEKKLNKAVALLW